MGIMHIWIVKILDVKFEYWTNETMGWGHQDFKTLVARAIVSKFGGGEGDRGQGGL
jgi:hypothetical protein